MQTTRLHKNLGLLKTRIENWSSNPARALSLLLIAVLIGFLLGSSITSVAGVLGQMDPVVTMVVVLGTELTIRLRSKRSGRIVEQMLDMLRIGLLYALFLEAFKLLA